MGGRQLKGNGAPTHVMDWAMVLVTALLVIPATATAVAAFKSAKNTEAALKLQVAQEEERKLDERIKIAVAEALKK